ncbi:MAG: hypothetical protein FWD36_07105 [Treponema sp.]|nr:hypothetical protein [Treponema sp.]
MRLGKKTIVLFLLLTLPILYIPAQANAVTGTGTNSFNTSGLPQWAKDLRRWEIVAFGSIPFTMFTATFAMDMHRWNQANGLDFTDEGRRYAPWPLKSAGAESMNRKEAEMTLVIAASLSVAVAVADQIIVQVKRHKARKKVESMPVGTTIITRKPWPEEAPGITDDEMAEENTDESASNLLLR